MTSGSREALKWLAVVLMTGDHVAKILLGGHVPVLSELGRIAFPVFALVMAYNLAQPGADLGKSIRRLLAWGLIAQPVHAFAFGYWLPLNVLLTFALAAFAAWCIRDRRWLLVAVCVGPAPLLVDYQWSGIGFVLAAWYWFCSRRDLLEAGASIVGEYSMCGGWRDFPWIMQPAWLLLCAYNGNGWALLALPVFWLGDRVCLIPRTRWAFYGYYVGHLSLLAVLAHHMDTTALISIAGVVIAAGILALAARLAWIAWTVRRDLRRYDEGKREV